MRPVVQLALPVSLLVLFFCSTMSGAAVCYVPSAPHPTIQEAVDDVGCTDIVIGAGTYVESVSVDRSLTVSGASTTGTTIEGRITVTGPATTVSLNDLTIDASAPSAAGCFFEALDVTGGASVTSNALVVVNADGDACLIFEDGFESGNTTAWSGTNP